MKTINGENIYAICKNSTYNKGCFDSEYLNKGNLYDFLFANLMRKVIFSIQQYEKIHNECFVMDSKALHEAIGLLVIDITSYVYLQKVNAEYSFNSLTELKEYLRNRVMEEQSKLKWNEG